MTLFILGGLVFITGVIFMICGGRRLYTNSKIKAKNQALETYNAQLVSTCEQLQKQVIDVKNILSKSQQESQESFSHYVDGLERFYQTIDNSFDNKKAQLEVQYKLEYERQKAEQDSKLDELRLQYNTVVSELEKIQHTYAAAIEARLREEEITKQADYYCLHLTAADKTTIGLFEELRTRLPEPRILSMLIWQSFYQKQAKTLCDNILKKATVCGIYKITNQQTGQCYIGQSIDVGKRWLDHIKCGLGIDTPAQNKLYKAMMENGITNFTFELLEECSKEQLNEKERFYIELYQSYNFGYNSNRGISK